MTGNKIRAYFTRGWGHRNPRNRRLAMTAIIAAKKGREIEPTMIHKILATILLMAAICNGEAPVSQPETKFPAERTFTDSQGRKMEVTIIGKTETTVKFTRKSDNKEFELPLTNISEDDRKFVADLKQPTAVPFDGHIAAYGPYFLIRIKGGFYGISIHGIPSIKSATPNDPCVYAIKYKIFEMAESGTAKLIADKTSDERDEKEKYHVIKCTKFEFEWSARGTENCYVHFTGKTMKSFNGAPIQGAPKRPDGLPKDAEYYSQQIPSLEAITTLDPTKWLKIPNK